MMPNLDNTKDYLTTLSLSQVFISLKIGGRGSTFISHWNISV